MLLYCFKYNYTLETLHGYPVLFKIKKSSVVSNSISWFPEKVWPGTTPPQRQFNEIYIKHTSNLHKLVCDVSEAYWRIYSVHENRNQVCIYVAGRISFD